jgi:hypothetical protein
MNRCISPYFQLDAISRRIAFERATQVVNRKARGPRNQPVGDPRGNLAGEQRIVSLLSPAVDQVVPLVEFLHEHRNIERVVLQVAVERHDYVAGGMLDAGLHCRRLPVVAAKADHFHAQVASGELFQPLAAAVGRAVIDEHNLPRPRQARQHHRQLLISGGMFSSSLQTNDDGNS